MTLGVFNHLISGYNSDISQFTLQYSREIVRNQRGIVISFLFDGNQTLNSQVCIRSMGFTHLSTQESLFIIGSVMIMHSTLF